MKRSLLSFILCYSLNLLDLSQLVKLPILFQHFGEHRAENRALTLSDFIAMHYGGDDRNESDNDRDQQLPFKSAQISFSDLAVPLAGVFNLSSPRAGERTRLIVCDDQQDFLSPSLSAIWQPPRKA